MQKKRLLWNIGEIVCVVVIGSEVPGVRPHWADAP